MAYNQETGVLTIDSANETFDEILDNTARALNDYRVTEVAGVLARDVGLLCTSPNINKWAKYKPVEVNKFLSINNTDRYNANHGFALSWNTQTTNIPAQLIDLVNKTGPSWTYARPTTWFRILDFDGYKHKDRTTPFQSRSVAEDGITKADQGTISTTHLFFECYWHQRASSIQPKDMKIFGDFKDTHDFKIGLVVKDPTKSFAELCFLYNSLNEANSGGTSAAIDMPLSVSTDTHNTKKYFKIPNTTSSSTSVWKAILVCVRVNKATGDKAWLPLPTEMPMTFTVDTATGDVSMFWGTLTTDMKPMVLVVPNQQSGMMMTQDIYLTNIFTGLYRFFQSTNLNFTIDYELYYNGSQAGSNSITQSTQPLATSGSGDSTIYTYRTAVRQGTGTWISVNSFKNLMLYVSVSLDNGDANSNRIYFKLDEITMQGNLMLIPKGTTTRVGYSIQSIMDALGPNNYQIVTSI